ncbi:TIGR04282 family arsenosugar biosynthesis glycosyltransferase [Bizionia sediminis]|uniref:TIGR04282 family arsenosugar biosynthesis glycosyltransferase n=1 Tax=Bizionia sediminis TaxID=1737064 RepID=A0ABW5KT25_9FLAO
MAIRSKFTHNKNQEETASFYFRASKNALIIFTRNPELGKCKTRLAKTVGNEAALEIYKHLLQHTATVAKQVEADRFVFYSEDITETDMWDSKYFIKKTQKGPNLGARMEHAFAEILELGYEKVLIIGSDLLDITARTIAEGFQKLNQYDYVFGPAADGGYYLLGMKTLHPKVFKNKAWSTKSVGTDTLTDLKNESVYLLQTLNDIDTFDDIKGIEPLKKYYQNHD